MNYHRKNTNVTPPLPIQEHNQHSVIHTHMHMHTLMYIHSFLITTSCPLGRNHAPDFDRTNFLVFLPKVYTLLILNI